MTTPHPWPVYGHDWAVEHLRRAIRHHRIRHAYLITGAEAIGRETLARAFAQAVNCAAQDEAERPCGQCRSCRLIASGSHPDVLYSELDASTGALKIEEVRALCGKIALKPFEARYRLAILRDFDRARPQAQDALLKTLEEPPPQAILIVIAPAADALLPTIVSRSQILALRPVPAAEIYAVLRDRHQAAEAQADLLARLSGGRMGWALRALADPTLLEQRAQALDLLEEALALNRARRFDLADSLSKDKLALFPLLELWQTYWRDVLLCASGEHHPANVDRREQIEQLAAQIGPQAALTALNATRETLRRLPLNINLRLALEVLLLDFPGLAYP